MVPETTHGANDTMISNKLYLAIELSQKEWKLGFTIGPGQAARLRSVASRNLAGLRREIELARERFGLEAGREVLSCYEAGRDGFYVHRYLESQGVKNLVVDSASIEVNRRFRRAKTDHLDVGKLLTMLTPALHRTQCGASVRYDGGERKVWSVVHVPSAEEEDRRQVHRELLALKRDRTHHINRIKGCWPVKA